MTRSLIVTAGLLLAGQTAAMAQAATVQGLMNDGYTVAGVITSPAGPGVFLLKGTALMLCFVAEKPRTPAVETQYCKPVK